MKVPTQKQTLLLLGLIVLLGAFFRLFNLNELPPGDGYDVAQYGVDALQILGGARPIFMPSNFGREVLFSYLVALVYQATGPGTFGIHLSSALIGIATIPAVFLAARALLATEKEWLRAWVPLLAALLTAVSYWHLNWSRVGLRVIWVPLFASLIVATLWNGLRTGRRRYLASAGLLLGFSLYTYQAARLLPVLVLTGFILYWIHQRRLSRDDLLNFLLAAGVALLVFAPLGYYAWQHPEIFNDRLRQATVLAPDQSIGGLIQAILEQSRATLLMFGVVGDNEPLFTIPGRPALNPFLFAGLLLGVGIAIWRMRRPQYLFLLVWLALMTAPAMLADQAATAKRALGAFPAVAILVALGLLVPWRALAVTSRRELQRLLPLYAFVIVAGLVYTTWVSYRDYFIVWANEPGLAAHFQRDHTEVGRYAATLPADEQILISPFSADHPAVQLHSNLNPNLRSYDGHSCLVYPGGAGDGVTYVVVPGPAEKSLDRLQALYPEGLPVTGPKRPDRGQPYYRAYRVPADVPARLQPMNPLQVEWQSGIRLLGYELEKPELTPGESLTITLYYEVLEDQQSDYTAFVHLLDDGRKQLWAQTDSRPCGGAFPTTAWRAGDIVSDTILLETSEQMPAGTYELLTGLYTWPELQRLPIQEGVAESWQGAVALTTIQAGELPSP